MDNGGRRPGAGRHAVIPHDPQDPERKICISLPRSVEEKLKQISMERMGMVSIRAGIILVLKGEK